MRSRMLLFSWLLPMAAGAVVAVRIAVESLFSGCGIIFLPADLAVQFLADTLALSVAQFFVLVIALRILLYALLGFLLDGVLFRKDSKRCAGACVVTGSALFLALVVVNASRGFRERLFSFDTPGSLAIASIPWVTISLALVWVGSRRCGVSKGLADRSARSKHEESPSD